ncbi:hypothetical protein [Botrimarina sp.]|uniref:hypothetical protein n=1 Tax=Botrimarina sp. TaxID=2795802 RepID=UPI0032EEB2B0
MNLLGKILVVALFVLSVIFMTLSVVVFSTHRNWKQMHSQVQQQYQDERQRFEEKVREYNALESRLSAEAEAALQQVRKLETESARLAEENSAIQRRLNQLSEKERGAVAAVTATQQANNQLADEVGQLRDNISEAIAKKDKSFDTALKATEALQSVRNDLETAQEYNRELLVDTGRMTRVMEANGLDPEATAEGVPPRVDGLVSRTQRRDGRMLVEISIGSDDGLRVNDTVEVFNGSRYKGRLKILRTAPDRAVGSVDVRYQKGPIQEGDRVATRLNLG